MRERFWGHKRRVKKRAVALFMTAVMLFGCVYNAAPAVSGAKTKEKAAVSQSGAVSQAEKSMVGTMVGAGVSDKVKATGINRLKTYGKHVVGDWITNIGTEIDEATDSEVGTKVTSWINTWVVGNDSAGAEVTRITELCNEILDELDHVEAQIDDTSAVIESMIANQDIKTAFQRMEDEWSSAAVPQTEEVYTAFTHFKKYLKAAQAYKEDSSKKEDYERAELDYRTRLIQIYTTNGGDTGFDDPLVYEAMTTFTIGTIIQDDLQYMINKLGGTDSKTPNYMDYSAQCAYQSMVFTSEQYNFIMDHIENQMLQICLMEFMLMDYLAWQGDYLTEHNKKDNDSQYKRYIDDDQYKQYMKSYGDNLLKFGGCNDDFVNEASELLMRPIQFDMDDPNHTTHLYTYMQERDEHAIPLYCTLPWTGKGASTRKNFQQRGILNEDGTVSPIWFMMEEKDITKEGDIYRAGDLSKEYNEASEYERHARWTDYVDDDFALRNTVNVMRSELTETDVLDRMVSLDSFRAAGGRFADVLEAELMGPAQNNKKRYIVVGKSGSDYLAVDMDAPQGGSGVTTVTWKKSEVEGEDKDTAYQLVLGFEPKGSTTLPYDVYMETNRGIIQDSEGDSYEGRIITSPENGTFSIKFDEYRYGNSVQIPVEVIASYYVNPSGFDKDYTIAMSSSRRQEEKGCEFTMYTYEDIMSCPYENGDYRKFSDIPVPYATDMRIKVVMDERPAEIPILHIKDDGNTLRVTFDSPLGASKVDVTVATDSDYEDIVAVETIDVDKEKSESVSATFNLDPKKIGIGTLQIKAQGYDERDYGTIYSEATYYTHKYVPAPVITKLEQPELGDVEVTVEGVEGTTSIEVQACADKNFPEDDPDVEIRTQILSAKSGTVTFRHLAAEEVWYFRARINGESWDGKEVTSGWCDTESENISPPSSGFSSIRVEDATTVQVTAAESSEQQMIEGYRFKAYTYYKDVSDDGVYADMQKQSEVQQEFEHEQEYTGESSDMTCTFENLSPVEWNFSVETYSFDEEGNKHYSTPYTHNKFSLGPGGSDKDVLIDYTGTDSITVNWKVEDYTTAAWSVDVNGKNVAELTTEPTLVENLPIEKNTVEVRNYALDPVSGKYVEGQGGKATADLTPDVTIASARIVAEDTIRVRVAATNPNIAFQYELYGANNKPVDGQVEETTETVHDFTGVPGGTYYVHVTPYITKSGGDKEYGKTIKSDAIYTGPPDLKYMYLDPYLTGLVNYDPEDPQKITSEPLVACAENAGNAKTVLMQFSTDKSFPDNPDIVKSVKASQKNGYEGKTMVDPTQITYFRMCSVWTNQDTGEDFTSGWSKTIVLDYKNMVKYDPVLAKELAGDVVFYAVMYAVLYELIEEIAYNIEEFIEWLEDIFGLSVRMSVEPSGGKALRVSIPEKLELSKYGAEIFYDGITVKLTKDKRGGHPVAETRVEGNEAIIRSLEDGSGFDEDQTYYAWISPFAYGDDEKKVVMNLGYMGPFEVKPASEQSKDSGSGTEKEEPAGKEPGATATPVPTTKPTQPPTPTPKAATGLKKGEKATAGSGATKAVYKATGKNTVTYLKTKVKKSAKKATVPATIKIKGKKYKVTRIAKGAFKGHKKLKTVIVKAKGLTKKKIKGCFKGTSVKTVKVPKKLYKKYKKIFTKKITGSRVKVKVKKLK